jgi:ribosome biogenesis protein NSA1
MCAGSAVQCYKGFSGSIRDVHCSGNAVITCGLDRFLRVHDIDSKKLIHKVHHA